MIGKSFKKSFGMFFIDLWVVVVVPLKKKKN